MLERIGKPYAYLAPSKNSPDPTNTEGRLDVVIQDGTTSKSIGYYNKDGLYLQGLVSATFEGALTGNATTATALETARTINGISFNGTANITITANTPQVLTAGTFLVSTGTFNGGVARTFSVDATSANTASKVVARDASGNFSAGTITAALIGNASTATILQTARTINGVSFNGSANININLNNSLTAGVGFTSNGTFNGGAARTFQLGTPSPVSNVTTNSVTGETHTHALEGELVETTEGNPLYYGARAFLLFNGTGGATIIKSRNIQSVVRTATGTYTVTFTTAMPDANFVPAITAGGDTVANTGRILGGFVTTTTTIEFRIVSTGNAAADADRITLLIYT